MTVFYDEMQGIASGLLKEFAQGTVEYVAITPGNGSPDEPGAPTETLTPINAAVRGVSFKYVDGANVLASDLQLTMPGDTVVPDPKGFIRVDGTRYKIVQIVRKPAAGIPVAFTIIFRR